MPDTKSEIVIHRKRIVVARYLLLVLLLVLLISTARQCLASYYFRQNLPDALQKAMNWDPANPVYPVALANLVHLYGRSPDPDEVIRRLTHWTPPPPPRRGYKALYRRSVQQAPDGCDFDFLVGVP